MYKNNWLNWSNVAPSDFRIHKTISRSAYSLHQELLENAKFIKDSITGTIELFFSGGITSQAILRSYLDLKIPFNVIIIKHQYNKEDVFWALDICRNLKINYKILDLDIEHFFNNDAERILQSCKCIDVKNLILAGMAEKVSGVPIFGIREPYVFRNRYFQSEKADWKIKLIEDDIVLQDHFNRIGRVAIADWFFVSPEVSLSYLQNNIIKNLTFDLAPGKLSSLSSRGIMYKQIWTSFTDRIKNSGFDSLGVYPTILPDFISEFYNSNILNKITHCKPLTLSIDDFIKSI